MADQHREAVVRTAEQAIATGEPLRRERESLVFNNAETLAKKLLKSSKIDQCPVRNFGVGMHSAYRFGISRSDRKPGFFGDQKASLTRPPRVQ
jgi:hypothetical protein